MSVRRLCEEEATEEEKAEAAGAELKTKTPHNDVGNYWSGGVQTSIFRPVGMICRWFSQSSNNGQRWSSAYLNFELTQRLGATLPQMITRGFGGFQLQ